MSFWKIQAKAQANMKISLNRMKREAILAATKFRVGTRTI